MCKWSCLINNPLEEALADPEKKVLEKLPMGYVREKAPVSTVDP